MSLEAVNLRAYAFQTEHRAEAAKMKEGGAVAAREALTEVLSQREELAKGKNLDAFIVDRACQILASEKSEARNEGIILLSQALSVRSKTDIQNIFRALHNKGQKENIDIHEIINGTLFFLVNSKETKKAIAVCKDKVLFPPADLPSAKIGKPDISTTLTKALGVLKIIENYLGPDLASDERAALRYFVAKERWEELKAFQRANPDNEQLKELIASKETDIETRLEQFEEIACKLSASQQKLLDQVEKGKKSPTAPGVTHELRCIMSKAMARCMYIRPQEGPDYEKAKATMQTIIGKGAAVRQNINTGDPGIDPKEAALKKQDKNEAGNFRAMLGFFLQNGVPTLPDKEPEFTYRFRKAAELAEKLKTEQDPLKIRELLQSRQENRAKLRDTVPPDFRNAYDDLDQMHLTPTETAFRDLEKLPGERNRQVFNSFYTRLVSSKALTPAMQKFAEDCKEKFDKAEQLEKAAKAEALAKGTIKDKKTDHTLKQFSEVFKSFASGSQMADGLLKISQEAFKGKEGTTQAKEFQAALLKLKECSEQMLGHFKSALRDKSAKFAAFEKRQTDPEIDGNTKADESRVFFDSLQQDDLASIIEQTSEFDVTGYADALLAIEKGVKALSEQFKGAKVPHEMSEVLKEFFDGQGMRIQLKGDLPSTVARGKLLEMAGRVVQQGTRPELIFKEILRLVPEERDGKPNPHMKLVSAQYSKLKSVADHINTAGKKT